MAGTVLPFISVLAVLAGCSVASVSAVEQPRSITPPVDWQGVREVRVLCLLQTDRPAERMPLQDLLCARVRALAADGAPVPVSELGFGDPAVLNSDAATLLVHASVRDSASGRLLIVAIRPFRTGPVDRTILFGAAPRAVPMSDGRAPAPAVDAALDAALAEILPWRGVRQR